MAALGHDFFDGYVWGRAASMGADVEPAVVVAAFGAFEPGLLTSVLRHGRSISSHDAVLAARAEGGGGAARRHRRHRSSHPGGLRRPVAGRVVGPRCHRPPVVRGTPRLATPNDRVRACVAGQRVGARPRGDGHTAARVASGLDAVTMNVLTERWLGFPAGQYSATRGFSPDRIDAAVSGLRRRGWLDALGDLTVAGARPRSDRSGDRSVAGRSARCDRVRDRRARSHGLGGQ